MKKSELIDNIAKQSGISKRQADEVLSVFQEKITDMLSLQQPVRIAGFGSFSTSRQASRQGRDIRTGEPIVIPSHIKPIFRPALALKRAIAESDRGKNQ